MKDLGPSTVKAVLGPTNTGKTHLAVERMCGHSSGLIGFPLRLLARARAAENQAWLALCNRVGAAIDGTAFAGGSCLVAPDGTVVADAGEAADVVVGGEVDVGVALRARAAFPVLPLRVPGVDE